MADLLDQLRELMLAFQAGALSPGQFTQQYMAGWHRLRREEDAAIEAHPAVAAALRTLREMDRAGEITSEQYWEGVEDQYTQLEDLRVLPGSSVAEALSQVFVESDAFSDEPDRDLQTSVSAEELHDVVGKALQLLQLTGLDAPAPGSRPLTTD